MRNVLVVLLMVGVLVLALVLATTGSGSQATTSCGTTSGSETSFQPTRSAPDQPVIGPQPTWW